MSYVLTLVSVPSVWRAPSESEHEAAKARFLDGFEDEQYPLDEKHEDESTDSPF